MPEGHFALGVYSDILLFAIDFLKLERCGDAVSWMHNFEACPLSVIGYSHHDALVFSSKILEVGWIVHENNDQVLLICIIFLLQVERSFSFNYFLRIPEMCRSLNACVLNVHGNNLVVSCVVDQKPSNNFVTFSNSTLGRLDKINAQGVCIREVPVY